ncbi:MAG: glutamate--tRNA ligase [Kiritimatiellia bacterium]|nr:glutamate--tRNA ligase [Kiritimatiellia bacterium]
MKPRVRFAPSPTGNVHIGNIRAAIFNWLYARHTGGTFLLRVEDTDLERSTPEAIRTLLDCMEWLKLDYDEPVVYQTTQVKKHLAAAEKLLADGRAYKENKGGKGDCVIFRMPKDGDVAYRDLVKGEMRKHATDTQDFVIVRSDGSPVFHLANVVDDITQGVTHVIRGDDHVENTFKHIELFKALGAEPPQYAHLPMIVNHMGKPYSKRDGAAFVGEFREQGYLPDALFNFLVLLGWAPGDDREIMSREELIAAFTLDRCKSSAARFDLKKLTWMNGEYIARMPRAAYLDEILPRLDAAGLPREPLNGMAQELFDQIQPRTKKFSDFPRNCVYCFTEAYPFDDKAVSKRLKGDGALDNLLAAQAAFEQVQDWTIDSTTAALHALAEQTGKNLGAYVHPVRVAVSGVMEGPGLFELLVLLGRERVLSRMSQTALRLQSGTL